MMVFCKFRGGRDSSFNGMCVYIYIYVGMIYPAGKFVFKKNWGLGKMMLSIEICGNMLYSEFVYILIKFQGN